MDYVIKNHKNVYIRLNQNGTPVACTKDEATLFEGPKAKNILDSMPRTLKRLNFKLEAALNIFPQDTLCKESSAEKKIIKKRIT